MNLQAFCQKIFCFWFKSICNNKWFWFNIFNKFELCLSSPWSCSMKHLIKNKSYCPNIAFGCIWLWFQYLKRHVQWRSNCCRISDSFCYIFFCKAEIANFDNSFTQHDICRLEIPTWYDFYLCTIPSLTKEIKPLQICFKN